MQIIINFIIITQMIINAILCYYTFQLHGIILELDSIKQEITFNLNNLIYAQYALCNTHCA